jgi:hypothetical protein
MTDRDPEPPPEDPTAPPGELVLAEEGGVRVFYISAPTMADLVDRLAPDMLSHHLAHIRSRVARRPLLPPPRPQRSHHTIKVAGISKTSAYQYFDGREDLLSIVLTGVRARLIECLGQWTDTATAEQFWRQLPGAADRLRRHLAEHPDDLALADAAEAAAARAAAVESEAQHWLAAVVANGRTLGVIRADVTRRC